MFDWLRKRIAWRLNDVVNHEYRQLRLEPIDHTEPDDVFIVGYPKSGNTWLQAMIASLVYGMDMRLVPDQLVQAIVPDMHYIPFYRRIQSPMFFKSHSLPAPRFKKVIYLCRDGRDVMASYVSWRKAQGDEQAIGGFISGSGHGIPGPWHQHIAAWKKNPYGADIHWVRYEDFLSDCVKQLRELCVFLDIERTDNHIAVAAESCAFAPMRQREIEKGWDNSEFPSGAAFVRRGQSGSHRAEIDTADVDVFTHVARVELLMLGYVSSQL